MKHLSLLLVLIPFVSFAQVDPCTKALDDVRLMCEGAQNACDDLKDCLVRRDTCVQGKPQNEHQCKELDQCMQAYKSDFGDVSRCDYVWAVPSSGDGFCRVKKHFLFSEEGCPGRTHGLLNALAYGLNGTVDNQYNCESVVDKRNDKVESCERTVREARQACSQGIPENLSYALNTSCTESANFASYRNREFALDSSRSTRVNDRSRRNSGLQGPTSVNTAPHTDSAGINR